MKAIYSVQRKRTKEGVLFQIINKNDGIVVETLRTPTRKKKQNKKWGCFLFFIGFLLSLFFDNEEDLDSGNDIKQLRIQATDSEKEVILKKWFNRVLVKQESKQIGTIKIKKIEYLSKYRIQVGNTTIGTLIPDSIWHNNLKLVNDADQPIATFTKNKQKGALGEITLYENLSPSAFHVLLGTLLLWFPVLNNN